MADLLITRRQAILAGKGVGSLAVQLAFPLGNYTLA
ncbi:uncharacterized protein METZ01_LOCUS281732 [marine metagenome]|uniref:Uncharacterized protein n=1 Tax=marine metagenome TaxID=408172 RepID=A0A382KW64_9ZZZZ